MPFDSLPVPPDRPQRRPVPPEQPFSRRDKVVAAAAASLLALITLAHCRMLLGIWHG